VYSLDEIRSTLRADQFAFDHYRVLLDYTRELEEHTVHV
jgi:hypothetical protein